MALNAIVIDFVCRIFGGGTNKTHVDLFACLRCALNFNGNPHDKLFITIMPDYVEYDPAEMSASIGLHGAYYMFMFRPGEYFVFCVA